MYKVHIHVYTLFLAVCVCVCVCALFRCTECVKASPYFELASQLEMTKALTYLKQRDIPRVSLVA